jgi:hypothetical protein
MKMYYITVFITVFVSTDERVGYSTSLSNLFRILSREASGPTSDSINTRRVKTAQSQVPSQLNFTSKHYITPVVPPADI